MPQGNQCHAAFVDTKPPATDVGARRVRCAARSLLAVGGGMRMEQTRKQADRHCPGRSAQTQRPNVPVGRAQPGS